MTRRRGPRLAVLLVAAAFTALAGLIGQAGLAALDRTDGWRARLGGEMTVAIRATEPAAVADASVVRATEILAGTEGVGEVRALDRSRVAELLAPWTAGARGPDLASLPRLIAVEMDPRKPARRQDLAEALNSAGIDAVVDDHQGWRRTATEFHQGAAALLIAGLMFCATGLAAIGAFAADQDMSLRRSTLRTRIQLGDTPLACFRSGVWPSARDLVIGVLAGGLTSVALGVLSGLAAPGVDPAGLAALAVRFSVLVGGASLVALVCALATAARKIRELEP